MQGSVSVSYTHLVADQVYEREKNNDMMVNILSHIVEFRNGESGQHVRHIHMMTEILLQHLQKRITKYQITQEDIVRIATASALHDIGKISIPDKMCIRDSIYTIWQACSS